MTQIRIDRGGAWAGDGTWTGARIDGCTADLGEEVYDALDEAIADAGLPVEVTVGGQSYSVSERWEART